MAECIKMPSLGVEVGLSPGDFVLDGNSAPPPKRGRSPLIFAHVWSNGWMDQRCHLVRTYRPRPRRHCVRWGPSSPSPEGVHPHFRPMSVVAKRLDELRCHLVWRKTSAQAILCLMGTQLPPGKRAQPPPNFWPCALWPKGLTAQDAIWHGGKPRPGDVVLDGVAAPL